MAVGTRGTDVGLVFEQQRSGLLVPTRTRDVQRPSQPIRQGGFEVTPVDYTRGMYGTSYHKVVVYTHIIIAPPP